MFKTGEFVNFEKIEYTFDIEDTLTEQDYDAIAKRFNDLVKFCKVISVGKYGDKLAASMKKLEDPNAEMIVVVDLATNKSGSLTKAWVRALADRDRGIHKKTAEVMAFVVFNMSTLRPNFCNVMFQMCHEHLEQ